MSVISEYSGTVSMLKLVNLPPEEANKAPFPPGCKVLCIMKDGSVSIGYVKTVQLSISFRSVGTFSTFYQIELKKSWKDTQPNEGKVIQFEAEDLRFTPGSPVYVSSHYFGTGSDLLEGKEGLIEGVLMGSFETPCVNCRKDGKRPTDDITNNRRFSYSVELKIKGMDEVVEEHGIPPEFITYRRESTVKKEGVIVVSLDEIGIKLLPSNDIPSPVDVSLTAQSKSASVASSSSSSGTSLTNNDAANTGNSTREDNGFVSQHRGLYNDGKKVNNEPAQTLTPPQDPSLHLYREEYEVEDDAEEDFSSDFSSRATLKGQYFSDTEGKRSPPVNSMDRMESSKPNNQSDLMTRHRWKSNFANHVADEVTEDSYKYGDTPETQSSYYPEKSGALPSRPSTFEINENRAPYRNPSDSFDQSNSSDSSSRGERNPNANLLTNSNRQNNIHDARLPNHISTDDIHISVRNSLTLKTPIQAEKADRRSSSVEQSSEKHANTMSRNSSWDRSNRKDYGYVDNQKAYDDSPIPEISTGSSRIKDVTSPTGILLNSMTSRPPNHTRHVTFLDSNNSMPENNYSRRTEPQHANSTLEDNSLISNAVSYQNGFNSKEDKNGTASRNSTEAEKANTTRDDNRRSSNDGNQSRSYQDLPRGNHVKEYSAASSNTGNQYDPHEDNRRMSSMREDNRHGSSPQKNLSSKDDRNVSTSRQHVEAEKSYSSKDGSRRNSFESSRSRLYQDSPKEYNAKEIRAQQISTVGHNDQYDESKRVSSIREDNRHQGSNDGTSSRQYQEPAKAYHNSRNDEDLTNSRGRKEGDIRESVQPITRKDEISNSIDLQPSFSADGNDYLQQEDRLDSIDSQEGCYLLYSENSGGKLVLHYSRTTVASAIGVWMPKGEKKIQGFKFSHNQGKVDLIKGIAGGDSNRRKYFNGWCQFVKAASTFDGVVCKLPEQGGIEVDLWVFYVNTCIIEKIEDSQFYDVSGIYAVACVPKNTILFDGMRTGELGQFLQKGQAAGASITIDGKM